MEREGGTEKTKESSDKRDRDKEDCLPERL